MDTSLNLNFCKLFFATISVSLIVVGFLINVVEPLLPTFVVATFRYGKCAAKESAPAVIVEVPKSYFRHFYFTAALIYYPIAVCEILSVYVLNNEVSEWVKNFLDLACSPQRTASVPATDVFIAVILLFMQVLRRFYDTHFVSVFSETAKINLSHYLIGMVYYPLVVLVVLSEAPKFVRNSYDTPKFGDVGLTEAFAVILFSWAWYHQHAATVILANLRKNQQGRIVSQGYKIPEGDWFQYLSSPHCTAEIIMYTALTLLLCNSSSWWHVYVWVLANQVECILLSHWWYQDHFKDFPKTTKALIPFVY